MKLSTVPNQAREQLAEYLTTADLSRAVAKSVANKLGTSETRMRLRLRDAGTTWQKLKDAERLRRLHRLMAENRASTQNCINALGYSSVDCLRRFFIRHTGQTLYQYQQRRREQCRRAA